VRRKIMALILSAGLGTRLLPITERIQKVMVDICGKPLIWYQVKLLKYYGITDLWINIHWRGCEIEDYLGNGRKFGVKVKYSYESKLLGTAGALKNRNSRISEDLKKGLFLVVYGDHLTDINYCEFVSSHRECGALMSIGLFSSDQPWDKGVCKTDRDGRVLWMKEKPGEGEVVTDQVSAGIFVCRPGVFKYIPNGFSDWGEDVIPKMVSKGEKLFAWNMGEYLGDIGTSKRLRKVRSDVKEGVVKFPWVK
jgi:NDP-sugar pyrophosphorylase family protein